MTFGMIKQLNEAKLHSSMNFGGMSISIEVPAGGYRTGKNREGKEWKHKIGAHYGYIKGTHSPDGEHLDCYVRKNPKQNAKVYVVHQLSVDGSKFDEDKVMLGFASAAEARAMFKSCTFKPTIMYGGMTEFTLEHFRVVAYSASRSKAMLTDEETFSSFHKRGLMPKGVISPLTVARRVSESVTEGDLELPGLLSAELETLGDALAEGDVRHCLETVGYSGNLVDISLDIDQLIDEAFTYFVGSGIQESNYLDDDEFRQRALLIISNEDALMTDVTDNIVSETPLDKMKMPQINFSDTQACKIAYDFANDNLLNVSCAGTVLYFHDANDYERYMELATGSGDVVDLMGDQEEDLKAAGYDASMDGPAKPGTVYDPSSVFPKESFTVVVSTQLLENVGTEFAPLWSHSNGRYIAVQTGLPSYGEARKIVAEVSAGLIPVELDLKESVIGIEIVTDGDYRQFYEAVEEDQDQDVQEDTTEDVFFQQQIQEVQNLAGVKQGQFESSVPSVHDLKARLAALSEETVEENSFVMPTSLEMFTKAMKIVGKTLLKNPNASVDRCIKAVARDVLGGIDYAEELGGYIQDQTGMGLEAYAAEVRDSGVVESQLDEARVNAAQQRGRDDYAAGKSLQDPPSDFPVGSALRGDWIVGWRFAERDAKASKFKR